MQEIENEEAEDGLVEKISSCRCKTELQSVELSGQTLTRNTGLH